MTDLRSRPAVAAPAASARRLPRRRTVLLAAAGVVALVLVVVWVVAFSPLFGVRTVRVRGASSALAAQVVRAADVGHGTPLVRLDTAAVTRRVDAVPDVASAQVSTSFPSTVTITVVPRVAVGYVARGSGGVLVDRDGVQYRSVGSVPARLPRFVLPDGAAARATAQALSRVAAALTAPLRRVVTSIQALNPGSISLTIKGGTLVRWGSTAASTTKAQVLPVLLRRHPDLIDLTDPARPFTR